MDYKYDLQTNQSTIQSVSDSVNNESVPVIHRPAAAIRKSTKQRNSWKTASNDDSKFMANYSENVRYLQLQKTGELTVVIAKMLHVYYEFAAVCRPAEKNTTRFL